MAWRKSFCVLSLLPAITASIILASMSLGWAEQICEVEFTTCPENFDGLTITVPDYATHLSASLKTCNLIDVVEGPGLAATPPTVIFIIDHSGSMTGTGYAERDRWGSRFTVTEALLDTLYTTFPRAQVGLVVFREYLWYDASLTQYSYQPYLTKLPRTYDGVANQSYLEPLILDQTYGNVKGIDIIKAALTTDTVTDATNNYSYVSLVHTPSYPTVGNTNINIAFIAAKDALKSAVYPKSQQFVIFLSDGEPRGSNQAGLDQNWFTHGDSVPTTFTVYFTDPGATVAPSLLQMTDSIRANGYSASNPYSNLWTLQTNFQSLLNMLMTNVINTIKRLSYGVPTRMVINQTYTSTQYKTSDSAFVFSQRFALSPDSTRYTMSITYLKTDQQTGQQKDTTHLITFTIDRNPSAPISDGVRVECSERSISLYYHGQPVTTVLSYMDTLEVRVTTGNVQITSLTTTIKNASAPIDNFQLALTNNQGVWTGFFQRDVSATAVAGDKILQHRNVDSIIVTCPDPMTAGGTLRHSVPFAFSKIISVTGASFHDRNADGFVDSVFIALDADVASGDATRVAQLITWPSLRSLTVTGATTVPGGVGIILREDATQANTATSSADKLTFTAGELPGGAWLKEGEIIPDDKMAPVIWTATSKLSQTGIDTIEVVFSEPVRDITNTEPFLFRSSTGNTYQLTLAQTSNSGANASFYIAARNPADASPVKGDTIWINQSGFVGDPRNIIQQNPANRRVRLGLKTPPIVMIPHVANNPYVPGNSPVPVEIRSLPGIVTDPSGNGVIIGVDIQNLFVKTTDLSATVSIYDVMMNPLVKNKVMAFYNGNHENDFFFVWDGTNSNGRKVGSGTYVALIRIDDGQGNVNNKRVRIGVKR
jgi:hypothetical protein